MTKTRTPPELKWVLNERAAVAGELQSIEVELARLAARRKQLTALLHHLDNVYCQLAPQVPSVPVLAVKAHHRYGGKGNCIAWVRATLKAAYPQSLTTADMVDAAQSAFRLSFADAGQREQFRRSGLTPTLRKLLALGEVERLHDYKGVPHRAGVWRWKPKDSSFDELAKQVRSMEAD